MQEPYAIETMPGLKIGVDVWIKLSVWKVWHFAREKKDVWQKLIDISSRETGKHGTNIRR